MFQKVHELEFKPFVFFKAKSLFYNNENNVFNMDSRINENTFLDKIKNKV